MIGDARQTLATNIRFLARKRRVPLNILAELASVSPTHLYDVLAMRRAATIDWVERLALALDVSVSDLLKAPQ